MRLFIQCILLLLLAALPVLIATSCENEDDVDEIFENKTWKITGATINGKVLSGEDLKRLYEVENTYYMVFQQSAVQGCLSESASFAGSWRADGKRQTFRCEVRMANEEETLSVLDTQLFAILKNATRYSGDAHTLRIEMDGSNFLRLTKI